MINKGKRETVNAKMAGLPSVPRPFLRRMRFKEEKTGKERTIVLVGRKKSTKLIKALKSYHL